MLRRVFTSVTKVAAVDYLIHLLSSDFSSKFLLILMDKVDFDFFGSQ